MEITKNPTIKGLLEKIKKYAPNADLDVIRLAYDFAAEAHQGQTRKSGESYIIHPLSAAHYLADSKIDPTIIAATLLHDVPEDTTVTLKDIEKNFGSEIAGLVNGITKLGKLKYRGVERYIENLRKMFVAMAEDVRVMIMKFADRMHNLQTLDALPAEKRYRIALESLEIYAPIAGRLGMDNMKGELEDLSFKYVYPKEYIRMRQLRDDRLRGKKQYLEQIAKVAKAELKKNNIHVIEIQGRNKRLYSLYQKLLRKDNDITKIYDFVAIRILVPTLGD